MKVCARFLILAIALPLSPAYASTIQIIGSSPLGMFANADLAIPANPTGSPVAPMKVFVQSAWSGTITVLNWNGSGFLDFDVTAMATPFETSDNSEYMDSWSSISAPWSVASIPWGNTQGSTPGYATVRLPFIAGVPQEVTFTATAKSYYVFGAYRPGVAPRLAESTIHSSLWISQPWIEGAAFGGSVVFRQDDPPAFASPEPATWLLLFPLSIMLFVSCRKVRPLGNYREMRRAG